MKCKTKDIHPAIFHAIWKPFCSYTARYIGLDNLRRLYSISNSKQKKELKQKFSINYHFHNIDSREVRARMDTPIVQLIVKQGHNWNTILRAIEVFMRRTGDDFTNASELLEVVNELEKKQQLRENK